MNLISLALVLQILYLWRIYGIPQCLTHKRPPSFSHVLNTVFPWPHLPFQNYQGVPLLMMNPLSSISPLWFLGSPANSFSNSTAIPLPWFALGFGHILPSGHFSKKTSPVTNLPSPVRQAGLHRDKSWLGVSYVLDLNQLFHTLGWGTFPVSFLSWLLKSFLFTFSSLLLVLQIWCPLLKMRDKRRGIGLADSLLPAKPSQHLSPLMENEGGTESPCKWFHFF